MSITFLVLKWLSQVLIVSSGIYGMFSDLYREDKQTKRRALTRAGYFNLSALLSGFILFGVTDYKERQDQREQRQKGEIAAKVTEEHFKVQAEGQNSVIENQKKQIQSQDDELRYLHHLILVQEIIDGWEISLDLSPGVIETARRQAESLKGKEDAYLRACLEFASIDARKSANEHWAITCVLGRPQGVLNLSFDLAPTQPAWGVFESTLDALLSSRFSISQSGGEDFVVLTRLTRPEQISFVGERMVMTVRSPRVKLSRLETPVPVIFRLDRETPAGPNSIRIRSLDPNLKLDETIRTKWSKRQVATRPHYSADPGDEPPIEEPVFAIFSGPHEIRGNFNKLLFSFEKGKETRR